jgi:hypothetical protein
MKPDSDIQAVFEKRFKGRGLTLPMLQFATDSIGRHGQLSDVELGRRVKAIRKRSDRMYGSSRHR